MATEEKAATATPTGLATAAQPWTSEKVVESTSPESKLSAPKTATHPPPILCLGMARTGTASLAESLRMLGIPNVHHGTQVIGPEFQKQWSVFDRAADAAFPVLPTYTGKPFTRAEWDEAFGEYGAVTDIASFYAMSLLNAYPDAQVILVERDIDSWLKSVEQVFKPWQSKSRVRMIHWIESFIGSREGTVSLKFELGWTESNHPRDIYGNARAAYERHYREIRASVPPERLLDYRLEDGWEPLCRFLGKDVPDVSFPRVNEAAEYARHIRKSRNDGLKRLARKLFLPCF
ncbi:uncharacterized protein N7473_012282 [Penicillium subrubescens]|uniref:P-loop containing nucleoside triphosphate hydrolase protein n=1 Tax=Penicillium subrubescens TaxID=1316194 RepID=A0A1Q5UDU8_9EURO|nr:uncharacterized protein N7473_012282 [Penicillium subrubescens]KAJ5881229.1 hypothetical protein N7473_012282 [Penicillium subrubescens]OKP10651.1 hypothetical protein PENSUB_3954 [Penicillium subrubescens]